MTARVAFPFVRFQRARGRGRARLFNPKLRAKLVGEKTTRPRARPRPRVRWKRKMGKGTGVIQLAGPIQQNGDLV